MMCVVSSGQFKFGSCRTMLNLTKFSTTWHYLLKQSLERNQTPKLRVYRYCFAWRFNSSLTSLGLMPFLFFSNLTTEKSLSMVDVQGKMVARPPKNLHSNGYVFWSPFQSFRYAATVSKLSVELLTSPDCGATGTRLCVRA